MKKFSGIPIELLLLVISLGIYLFVKAKGINLKQFFVGEGIGGTSAGGGSGEVISVLAGTQTVTVPRPKKIAMPIKPRAITPSVPYVPRAVVLPIKNIAPIRKPTAITIKPVSLPKVVAIPIRVLNIVTRKPTALRINPPTVLKPSVRRIKP